LDTFQRAPLFFPFSKRNTKINGADFEEIRYEQQRVYTYIYGCEQELYRPSPI